MSSHVDTCRFPQQESGSILARPGFSAVLCLIVWRGYRTERLVPSDVDENHVNTFASGQALKNKIKKGLLEIQGL